jgi:adenylyltransferase/sulfurtransferase
MNDEQLLRYSRQIMLPQVDLEGQERLIDARALIIGVGGLGAPAAMYLAAAGVGTIVLADDDRVDLSNLQRQVIHHTDDIGKRKIDSARDTLRRMNPEVQVIGIAERLSGSGLEREASKADVVLDCSDNFATRFAVNAACVRSSRPLVSGAVIRFEGQVAVFDRRLAESPCYHCLYPDEMTNDPDQNCARSGVVAPLPGIIGSLQALEAMKLLIGAGKSLAGRLLLFDALSMEWTSLRLPRHPNCPTCSAVEGS